MIFFQNRCAELFQEKSSEKAITQAELSEAEKQVTEAKIEQESLIRKLEILRETLNCRNDEKQVRTLWWKGIREASFFDSFLIDGGRRPLTDDHYTALKNVRNTRQMRYGFFTSGLVVWRQILVEQNWVPEQN